MKKNYQKQTAPIATGLSLSLEGLHEFTHATGERLIPPGPVRQPTA